jgi:hypothetical protein
MPKKIDDHKDHPNDEYSKNWYKEQVGDKEKGRFVEEYMRYCWNGQ